MQRTTRKIFKQILRAMAWAIVGLISLILVAIAIIQIPSVQQRITQRAISFLEEKIGTDVELAKLYIGFPKSVVLEGLYLEDQSGDTLLFAGQLTLDTDLWALFQQEVRINTARIENTSGFVRRSENDTLFNYSYILKAFAGDSTAVPDTLEEKGWNFVLQKLQISNMRLLYDDRLTGNALEASFGELGLSMRTFDLYNYRFALEDLTIKDSRASLVQSKPPEVTVEVVEQSTDTVQLDISFDEIQLENISLGYRQQALGQIIEAQIGKTVLEANEIDLRNRLVDLQRVSLQNTALNINQLEQKTDRNRDAASSQGSAPGRPSSGNSPTREAPGWDIRVRQVSFENNRFRLFDATKPSLSPETFDPNDIAITAFNLGATDLRASDNSIHGEIDHLSFSEHSGFEVKRFQGQLDMSDDSAAVERLALETGNSRLSLQARAQYPSLQDLASNLKDLSIWASVDGSHLGIRDLFYFNPSLRDSLPLTLSPSMRILLAGSVSGPIQELRVHNLGLKMLSDTEVDASGTVAGLPELDRLRLDLSVDKLYTTRADISAIVPDSILPDSIALPEWINMTGGYKGDLERADFTTTLASNIGSVTASGEMNLDSISALRGFKGKVDVDEFDLGSLLMQPQTIGKIDLRAEVKSRGITPDEMNAELLARVASVEYNGYTYENLNVSATVRNDSLKGKASYRDKNLDFALDAGVAFGDDIPHYDLTFDLRHADFRQLQLTERPLRARGTLDVDMATADLRVLNGSLSLRKVAIFNGDKLYAVDSMLFASIDQEGRSEIKIDSDVLEGRFEGSINIFTIHAVVREYFNHYYSLHDSVEQSYEEPQHFNFHLNLKKTALLTDIIFPELHTFKPGEINGYFDSQNQSLRLQFGISEIQYSNIGVHSFTLSTNSDSSELNFNFLFDQVMIDSMRIDGLEFNGTVAHDSIRTNVVVRDSLDYYKYIIGGIFYSRENEFELHLDTAGIRLNYQEWTVPAENFIRFGGKRLLARDVRLTHGDEQIVVDRDEKVNSPLYIGFRQLNLEYLSSMIAQEKPVSGLLEGDIRLFVDEDPLPFTTDIAIHKLAVSQVDWGDLKLSVERKLENRFDVDFSLAGDKNNMQARGYYESGDKSAVDIRATVGAFDLSVLGPLLGNYVTGLTGQLNGSLHGSGSLEEPVLTGRLNLSQVSLYSIFLKTPFKIGNESLVFNNRGITLNEFDLTDANNNKATLDGEVITRDYRDFSFNLDLTTKKFQLLNTAEGDNDLFFGTLNVNAEARIRGTMENPDVDMELSLTDGDHLTYIVPQEQATILETQGIVRFVDKTFKGDPFMKAIQPELSDTVKSTFRGIDLTAKVELTDDEALTIIIDPTTEDQLTVKGNTTLTLQMDRTGDVQLSGRYEISEGTYNLSFYKFVKREFSIESGSTMVWTGDPLNASMDIQAVYRVETSPVELLSNQLASQEELNRYRQRLPFLVYLVMKGELLKPEISFRLEMPMEERNALGGNVYARLQDINTRESDLNKQVFALIILKRFIADNPLENRAGAGFEGTARTSVSKILTEQLNQLSENIRGVELSFDVKSYEDYSTGTAQGQTELQLGLSKRLLDDRLVVKLSGNVDIEGETTNREVTDYIGDLAIEYLLTEDGRFRVTGFRNSNYDMIDGELIETGAGLIFIKDYDAFRELFKADTDNQRGHD